MFILDETLARDTIALGELPLCRVLLMNNRLYPWLILVPRRSDIIELTDLIREDRLALMDEISAIVGVLRQVYWPDKINVASLGNVVAQLHVHVIVRFKTDEAWPEPIWGKGVKPYSKVAIEEASLVLKRELQKIDGFIEDKE